MNAISKQMDLFGELPKQKKIKAAGGALAVGGEQGNVMSIGELTDAYNMYRGNADSAKLTSDEMDAILDIFLKDMPSAGKSYAEGGMEDGGLKDEGGEIDPVSGNDVPPGSTKEEVRDDIPAQLSEGEFVFPADVVRYIGLENLMRIRQEAKQGLKMMEAMGQMGNSEEATIPDDLPFAITDLIIVDTDEKEEYNNDDETKEMNVGGFLPPNQQTQSNTGVYYQPSNLPTTTGVMQPPVAASSSYQAPTQYAAPVQQFTPTIQTQTAPKATEFLKGDEEAARLVTVINPDTGEEKQINFIPGVTQLPEGFVLKSEYSPEEKVTSQTATTQSTTVRDSGDDDGGTGDEPKSGSTIAFGGNLNRKGTVDNAIRGQLSFRGANAFGGPFAALKDVPGMLGRTRSAGLNRLSGDKFGQPMSLKEGESAIISNMVQSRPGVNRSTPIATGVSLELPANFYNKFVSGSNVTQRKTLAEIANYLDKNYDGLGEGSVINAEQILNEINKEKKEAAMAEKVAEAQRKAAEARQLADEQARKAALDAAFGARDDSSDTGYTRGSVIDTAIRDAQDYMSQQDSSSDEGGQGGGTVYDGGGYDPTGGAGYGTGTDCLTEKMKVKLNGVIDFVTNVKVGDIIDSFKVKEVIHKHMRDGYFVINNELEITNDHPVLANGTWTKPEELYVGDYINDVKVKSIKYIDHLTPTVSIVVDGDSFDVYTEGSTYTVHGRYKEVRQQAA